jgi:hypothetical protein
MPNTSKKPASQQRFLLSSEWSVGRVTAGIQINAGEDLIYEIACEAHTADFFCALPKSFTKKDLPASAAIVFEQLLSAQVILPASKLVKTSPTHIDVISDSTTAAAETLADLETAGYIPDKANPDITIIIRTGKTLSDFLKAIVYKDIRSIHLFIDLAYHHTLSLGPLVFPGDTPCIACLEGRLLARWGSQAPPALPRGGENLRRLAAEFAVQEIARFVHGDTSLTFKTVAVDTEQRSMETYTLLTVPQCPYCKSSNAYANGMLVL